MSKSFGRITDIVFARTADILADEVDWILQTEYDEALKHEGPPNHRIPPSTARKRISLAGCSFVSLCILLHQLKANIVCGL